MWRPNVCLVSCFQDKYFLLELKSGFLHLMYDFGFSTGPQLLEDRLPKLQINDARYHEVDSPLWFRRFDLVLLFYYSCCTCPCFLPFAQVSVIYHQSKKVILLVDKSHVKSMENPKTTLPFSDIYIGGAPSSILQSRWVQCSIILIKGQDSGSREQSIPFSCEAHTGVHCCKRCIGTSDPQVVGGGFLRIAGWRRPNVPLLCAHV